MNLLFLDFETYWSKTHSLSKMNPVTYVTHPDTEIISVAFAWNNNPVEVIFGEDAIAAWAGGIDWSKVIAVGHNMSQFDSMILAWRLGALPRMWGCTLAMARPFFGLTVGGSLKQVAKALGVGAKGSLEATHTQGKRFQDFTPAERAAMAEYNRQDTALCREVYRKLLPRTSAKELRLIDLTTRMLVEPSIEVDTAALEAALAAERVRKVERVAHLASVLQVPVDGVQTLLSSNPQFAGLLRSLGVEPPMKISKATGKPTYALAKDDEGLQELLNHPNPMVAAAAECRLGVKSTLLESRIETFLEMSRPLGGRLPIALNYWGAHTGRWSGGMKQNAQNLPRIDKEPRPTDVLRQSMQAPPGYAMIVVDLSAIELRVNHFLWRVSHSMTLFQQDPQADLYRAYAAMLYGCTPEEVTKAQRQIAKVMQLGLGYGAGWRTFVRIARTNGVELEEFEAEALVARWRSFYHPIVEGWQRCDAALSALFLREERSIDDAGLVVARNGAIEFPTGAIQYPDLRRDMDPETGRSVWRYGSKGSYLYGGRLTENIVQGLARHILAEQMLRIHERFPIAHTVHDEVVVVVREDAAEEALAFILDVMRSPPSWWPDLVLWAEGGIGTTYAEAK